MCGRVPLLEDVHEDEIAYQMICEAVQPLLGVYQEVTREKEKRDNKKARVEGGAGGGRGRGRRKKDGREAGR